MRFFITLLLLLLTAPTLHADNATAPVANATQTEATPDPFAAGTSALPVRVEETRDPFVDPYKFAEAIHRITVMGIVVAGDVERIIVHIDGYDELAVMKTGDAVAVNHNGLRHEFLIKSVTAKSVRFEAVAKNVRQDAASYEVFLL